MLFGLASALFACGTAGGAVFNAKDGDSMLFAVAAARKAGGTNEIVVAPGKYYFSRLVELDERDSGLTIRAEKPGQSIFYGGVRLAKWRPDGDGFWAADVPEFKGEKIDFRALVVNGRLAERAVWPGGTNQLDNLGVWKVRMLPALAGWWERPATQEELSTMPYKPGDLPPGFDSSNAEVRCYHMWSDSLLRVASNDTERAVLRFTYPAAWPPGACGKRKYVVYNIREGMKEPGQWYLDRTAGKVVYWPLPGEDMAKIEVVAPRRAIIMRVKGAKGKPVERLTISGISFQAATPPYGRCGFGARDVPAAFTGINMKNCLLEGLDVCNTGGMGIMLRDFDSSRLVDCVCEDVGACAVCLSGKDSEMSGCRLLRTGRLFSSSCGLSMGGTRIVVRRNEIAETPYSGVIMGGSEHLLEENLVRRVMRVMHDGAAFYGNISRCTLRGNVVRDVVEQGKGFGASAYYVDEGGTDNLFERNVAEGVPMPVHNHITRNTRVVDNFFISDGDMTISFQNSIACSFERNTLVVGGTLRARAPNAVEWKDNRVFKPRKPSNPSAGFYIGDGKPDNPPEKPQSALVSSAITNGVPPVFDGEWKSGEWPGLWTGMRRDATRRIMGGAPSNVRAAHDAQHLYILVQVTSFHTSKLSGGHEWGKDDAAQVDIGPLTLRGFIDGTVTCSDASLAGRIESYAGLAKKNRGMGKQQLYAFCIPRDAVAGWMDAAGYVPFNARVFASEHGETRYYEAPEGDAPACRLKIKD
jgi:hypothetical protein